LGTKVVKTVVNEFCNNEFKILMIMKRISVLFVLMIFATLSLSAQKSSCSKSCTGHKASASVVESSSAAMVAAKADKSIEVRTCEESGKVSYYKKDVCDQSGKVSYTQVEYQEGAGKFVSLKENKSGKMTSELKDGTKKDCSASCKTSCSKSKHPEKCSSKE